MGYSIRLEGDVRKLMKRLKHYSDLDKKHITAAMAEAVRTSTLERYKQEKDPEGKKWKSSIRAEAEGGKTLTDTARLRNSIRAKSDASGFTVGTNTIYASTHQLGEKGRKITIRAKSSKGLVFKIGDRSRSGSRFRPARSSACQTTIFRKSRGRSKTPSGRSKRCLHNVSNF